MNGNWLELLKALITGVGLAIPVLGVLVVLHKERGQRFSRIEDSLGKLDTDFDGLIRQLASVNRDVEARFVTKEENTAAIQRLDTSIVELSRTLGRYSDQLIQIARDNARRN